jgi:hypothetical protein
MTILTGTVTGADGDPFAGVTVRVFRRDTGGVLGTTTTVSEVTEVPADSSYDDVTLLLNFEGADGSTDFTDQSPTPKTLVAVGSAHIDSDGYSYGVFDVGAAVTSASSVLSGAGPYTVEAWIYSTSTTAYQTIFSTREVNDGSSFGISPGSGIIFTYSTTTGVVSVSKAVPVNKLIHVEWAFDGTNLRTFLNGELAGTSATALSHGVNTRAGAGPYTNAENFVGNMYALRVTSTCRHTASFTPPDRPFIASSSSGITLPVGGYYLNESYSGEVNVISYAATGASLNDLVHRLTLP